MSGESPRCPDCGETDPTLFGVDRHRRNGLNNYCKACVRRRSKEYRDRYASQNDGESYSEYQTRYRKSTPERLARWKASRMKTGRRTKYNLDHDEFLAMLVAQDDKCAICLSPFDPASKMTTAQVDHDHESGRVRELLCGHCNRLLGDARESQFILSQAITYLRRNGVAKIGRRSA